MFKITKKQFSCIFAMVFLLANFNNSNACTGIMLKNKDGSIVHGRTLEFGFFIDTSIVYIPKGYQFLGKTPNGDGLAYQAKYAAIGTIAYDDIAILDGINQKGLSVGAFYFPTFAKYTPVTAENQKKGLSPSDFPNWLLTNFATVDEIKKALNHNEVVITPTILKGWGDMAPPFHYVVFDINGKSIVIEPLDGKLTIRDNPLGVLTNSPTFDWHMTNLRNYIALSPNNIKPVSFGGVELEQLGQGSGMLGLPGNFSPPARFIRAVAFSTTAIPSEDSTKGIEQVFHILNNFDIPVGVAREEMNGQIHTDYTMLTIARDPKSLAYYFKSYDDQTIRSVNLEKVSATSGKKLKIISTKNKQKIIDMSNKMQDK
jgi:choloylglycine hydrolase